MIVKILSSGGSFKGLSAYLTHDPEAQTQDRVAWTHTINLANDHVPSAVDEMVWAARDAELLKQEAGIRAGGRATEKPVKHLSLNWAPEDQPSREHMIEMAEAFLRHMKWQDHQVVLVAHQDKEFAHVHGMLNVVHPETGLRLDDNFEQRRAQKWALAYEQEQGRIHCEQRLKDPSEREDAPTRPAWQAFQKKQREFEREEQARRAEGIASENRPENKNADEWKTLKEMHRLERERFFAEGKTAFSDMRNSIYREVREEFRPRWKDYFTAREGGADPDELATLKSTLTAEQKAALEGRRDTAYGELREQRNGIYRGILDGQRETRHELHARQAAGLDNLPFLRAAGERSAEMHSAFQEASTEVGAREETARPAENAPAERSANGAAIEAGVDAGTSIGVGVGAGLLSFLGGAVLSAVEGPPPPRQSSGGPDPFEAAAAEASQRLHQERFDSADREWRERERTRVWD